MNVDLGMIVWLFAVGVVGLVVISLRWILATPTSVVWPRWVWGCFGAGLVLVVFGVRVWGVADFVSWAPYLDQWKAEVFEVLLPLGRGTLRSIDLVAEHNDHRIVSTRILTILMVWANGEWDNRVTAVLGLLMQAMTIAWVSVLALKSLGPMRGALVAAAAVWPAFLVCDWENVVSGFQTQFHVLTLGSLLVLSLFPDARIRSVAGVAVLLLAAFLPLTMGSGFCTALAAAAALGFVWLVSRERSGSWMVLAAAFASIAALGIKLRPEFHALDSYHAHGVGNWWRAFVGYAAWPFPAAEWGLLALWLPWLLLIGCILRRRVASPFEMFVVGLGVWILLQAAGLAYGRAGFLPLVSSRYTGLLVWSGVANAAALALILPTRKIAYGPGLVSIVLTLLWGAALATGLTVRSQTTYRPALAAFRQQTIRHEVVLGDFMRTNDASLLERASFPEIPYPVPADLVSWLREPGVRAVMPAPLRRDAIRTQGPAAVSLVAAGPLTHFVRWLLRNSPWVIGVGVGLLVYAIRYRWPTASTKSDRTTTG